MTGQPPDPIRSWRAGPTLVLTGIVVVLQLGASAWAWGQIPDATQIPIHWGIDGTANGWAPKEVGLLLVPLLTAVIGGLLAFLPRFEPRRTNLARSSTAYRAVVLGFLVLLGGVHAAAVIAATGMNVQIGRVVVGFTGALFAVIGNYLPKVRSNFMFGVRTPWTLASDRSWNLTHRLTGRLWMLFGLVMVVIAVAGLGGEVAFGTLIVGILGTLVLAVVYSYRVWVTDPDRQQIGR